MEAIDIAHLQGGELVGSKVCFVDTRHSSLPPVQIRTVNGDDYAAIREVVSRRYRDAGGRELYPDLIQLTGDWAIARRYGRFADLSVKLMVITWPRRTTYLRQEDRPIQAENLRLKLCRKIRDGHRCALPHFVEEDDWE